MDSEQAPDSEESSEGEDVEDILGGAKKKADKSSFEKRQDKVRLRESQIWSP